MAANETIPKWFIGVIVIIAGAIATVGAIAITNAATISEYKQAMKSAAIVDAAAVLTARQAIDTQFRDIKDRLIRIENKLDK